MGNEKCFKILTFDGSNFKIKATFSLDKHMNDLKPQQAISRHVKANTVHENCFP